MAQQMGGNMPALPAFEAQPKAKTPPQPQAALAGMKPMTPRDQFPPAPPGAQTPPGGGSRKITPTGTPPPEFEGAHQSPSPDFEMETPRDTELSVTPPRTPPSAGPAHRVMRDGSHNMMPPVPPGPPGGKQAPPFRPPALNGMPQMPGTPSGGFGNPQPKTPTMAPPNHVAMMPGTPKGMPPVIAFGAMNPAHIVQRGQPPTFHRAPFKMPPPQGFMGLPQYPPTGAGMQLAMMGQTGPGGMMVPGGSPMMGMQSSPLAAGAPLPPPPPREDDSAFVRRVRLIYMDRVMREHQKQDILELDAVGRPIPNWVFNLSALMPYIACVTFIGTAILIILAYSLKYSAAQEQQWYGSCIVGFLMVVFMLDIIRSAVGTIVELRKYEIRKRAKAGDFVVRKVQSQGEDDIPAILKPKPKVKAKPTPPIPNQAPKFNNMERPDYLNRIGAPDANMPQELRNVDNMALPPPGMQPPSPANSGRRTPPLAAPQIGYGTTSPREAGLRTPPGGHGGKMPPPPPLVTRSPRSGVGSGSGARTPPTPGGIPKPPPPPPM